MRATDPDCGYILAERTHVAEMPQGSGRPAAAVVDSRAVPVFSLLFTGRVVLHTRAVWARGAGSGRRSGDPGAQQIVEMHHADRLARIDDDQLRLLHRVE